MHILISCCRSAVGFLFGCQCCCRHVHAATNNKYTSVNEDVLNHWLGPPIVSPGNYYTNTVPHTPDPPFTLQLSPIPLEPDLNGTLIFVGFFSNFPFDTYSDHNLEWYTISLTLHFYDWFTSHTCMERTCTVRTDSHQQLTEQIGKNEYVSEVNRFQDVSTSVCGGFRSILEHRSRKK